MRLRTKTTGEDKLEEIKGGASQAGNITHPRVVIVVAFGGGVVRSRRTPALEMHCLSDTANTNHAARANRQRQSTLLTGKRPRAGAGYQAKSAQAKKDANRREAGAGQREGDRSHALHKRKQLECLACGCLAQGARWRGSDETRLLGDAGFDFCWCGLANGPFFSASITSFQPPLSDGD